MQFVAEELQEDFCLNTTRENSSHEATANEISSRIPPPTVQTGCNLHCDPSNVNNDSYVSHSLPTCRLTPHELEQAVKSFTSCQLNAYSKIKSHYTLSAIEPLHLFISGPGGVGKSFLINSVISYLQIYHTTVEGASPVLVCAPTGTAARNIKGYTIHSLLKIPVQQFLKYEPISNPLILKDLREKFTGVHTLIIDEISMVSATMLSVISNRLTEIFDTTAPFGNINMIVLGDLFQLRPVRGRHCFHNHALWRMFSLIKLTTNMRQSADIQYAQLLNRARIAQLQPANIELLKSRLIDPECSDMPNALHIYPTRKQVEQYNEQRQSVLNPCPSVIYAFHYFSDQQKLTGTKVDDYFIPEDDRDAGSLPNCLHLSVGTRVMLIRNIMTETGLVNGVMGCVHNMLRNSDGIVSSVFVLFDSPEIGRISSINSHQAVEITRITHTYTLHGRFITREQFPLVPCWACTVHKVQGATLQQVVIDLGSSIFEDGMAYVALSRVSTLQGLYLTAFNVKKISASTEVLNEYARLRDLNTDNSGDKKNTAGSSMSC